MRSVLGELLAYDDRADADVVVDMEAGLEHLSRGTTRHVDALLAVAEPYYRSLETARRIYALARELEIERVGLIANKMRDREETDAIRAFAGRHDLAIEGEIPFDEAIVRADRTVRAPLDAAGPDDSPALAAIERLTGTLLTPDKVAAR